ncbi:hypothetical protein EYF80_010219 [Liparis tanakae]|uniref:Uncharacterized protein n=1 Tax=Liparis tanakae TaxID=230148 RepID=A0A4Z2IPB3_9TELE|nr:hypothetical protein EYF80_010219 [Liparis tanakae]
MAGVDPEAHVRPRQTKSRSRGIPFTKTERLVCPTQPDILLGFGLPLRSTDATVCPKEHLGCWGGYRSDPSSFIRPAASHKKGVKREGVDPQSTPEVVLDDSRYQLVFYSSAKFETRHPFQS